MKMASLLNKIWEMCFGMFRKIRVLTKISAILDVQLLIDNRLSEWMCVFVKMEKIVYETVIKYRSSHTAVVAMMKIFELLFELLDHSLYSPDLAPNDIFLFPRLKVALGMWRRITFVNNYFATTPNIFKP